MGDNVKMIDRMKNSSFVKKALKKQKEICLEVGCGTSPKHGFIHCDVRRLPNVDIVCSAWQIPFPNNTVDKIYSRHMIEHLSKEEAIETLTHWFQILKIGGIIDINTPDLEKTIEQFKLPGESPFLQRKISNELHALNSLFGWQTNPFDLHKWGYSYKTLSKLLQDIGFKNIRKIEDVESKSGPLNLRLIAYK